MSGQGPVGNVAESMNVLMSTLNVLTRRMVSTFVLVDGLIGLPFSSLLDLVPTLGQRIFPSTSS